MPWKHGKGYWAWATLRDERKRVPLGTNDRALAREIEGMLRQLAGKREWALWTRRSMVPRLWVNSTTTGRRARRGLVACALASMTLN